MRSTVIVEWEDSVEASQMSGFILTTHVHQFNSYLRKHISCLCYGGGYKQLEVGPATVSSSRQWSIHLRGPSNSVSLDLRPGIIIVKPHV